MTAVGRSSFSTLPLPSIRSMQSGLMVMSTISAGFSVAYSHQGKATVAHRSIALLASLLVCSADWEKKDMAQRALDCARTAAVALGLAGVVKTNPLFITASVASILSIHCLEAIKAFGEKDDVIGYNVYWNGVKIAALNSSIFQYDDHNQKKNVPITYLVASVEASGQESTPLSIVVG